MLGISRSTLYYRPRPISEHNLLVMHTIDKIYTNNSDGGYRQIHLQLTQELGFTIGKNRVLKYMNILGIEALHPKAKKLTSVKESEHKIYPYLLSQYHNDKKQVGI